MKKKTQYASISVVGLLLMASAVFWAQVQTVQAIGSLGLTEQHRIIILIVGLLMLTYGAYRYNKATKKYAALKSWRQQQGLRA